MMTKPAAPVIGAEAATLERAGMRRFSPPVGPNPPRLGPAADQLSERGREILDQVEEIIVTEGFAHLTIGDLAARIGCSRRALYHLAPTKDELILVALDRRLRRHGRLAIERVSQAAGPTERVVAFVGTTAGELRRITARFGEDLHRRPAVGRLFEAHYRYAVAVLMKILDEGVAAGEFQSLHSRVIAEVIDAATQRLLSPELLQETGLTYEDAVAEFIVLLEGGLALHAGSRARGGPRS